MWRGMAGPCIEPVARGTGIGGAWVLYGFGSRAMLFEAQVDR